MRIAFLTLLVVNLVVGAWLVAAWPAGPAQPPPLPADVSRLQLLSERDAAVNTGKPAPQRAVRAGETLACYTAGPFETEADARRVAGELNAVQATDIRRTQAESEIGHWVYLPAFDTRDQAMAMARRLSNANLHDYYVVTSGDQENTISLGLYRDRSNAQRRVERLRELGFDARVKVRTESVPRYWLDVSLGQAAQVDWPSMLAGYEDASASRTECQH